MALAPAVPVLPRGNLLAPLVLASPWDPALAATLVPGPRLSQCFLLIAQELLIKLNRSQSSLTSVHGIGPAGDPC